MKKVNVIVPQFVHGFQLCPLFIWLCFVFVGRRNKHGDDRLYVRKGHKGFDFLTGLYENEFDPNEEVTMDPEKFEGVAGFVLVSKENVPLNG